MRFWLPVLLLTLAAATPARAQWTPAGLPNYRVRVLAAAPTGTRFACTNTGLLRSTDAGASWQMLDSLMTSDAFSMAIAPDSNQVFIAVETGVYRSGNDGDTWTFLGNDIVGAYSLGINRNGDVYASGSTGTWRSADRGRNSMQVHEAPGIFTDGLAFDPDGRVFLTSIVGDLVRSTNDGASWDTLPGVDGVKTALAVSPVTGTVFVGLQYFDVPASYSIYRSADHGDTWQLVLHRIGSMGVMHAMATGHILAGVAGVLRSLDDGLTWQDASTGLPSGWQSECFAEIDGVAYDGGEGLWSTTALLAGVGPGGSTPTEMLSLRSAPNPFESRTTIRFELPAPSRVTLDVFTLQGQRVARLIDGDLPAGPRAVTFEPKGLPAGIYFCRLSCNDGTRTGPLMLLK